MRNFLEYEKGSCSEKNPVSCSSYSKFILESNYSKVRRKKLFWLKRLLNAPLDILIVQDSSYKAFGDFLKDKVSVKQNSILPIFYMLKLI